MVRRGRALRGLPNAQDFSCMRSQEIFSGESRCSQSAFRLDPATTKKGVEYYISPPPTLHHQPQQLFNWSQGAIGDDWAESHSGNWACGGVGPIKDFMNLILHVLYSSLIPHNNPHLSFHQDP